LGGGFFRQPALLVGHVAQATFPPRALAGEKIPSPKPGTYYRHDPESSSIPVRQFTNNV
jgi:hypothetical protein